MTTILIAIWGAIISTILLIVKLIELYKDRIKFDVTTVMYAEQDNTLTVANLYKYPVTVCYFQLILAIDPKNPLAEIGTSINSLETFTIKSHETFTVTWNRPNQYFTDDPNSAATYYVVMSILGRKKPVYLKVFT